VAGHVVSIQAAGPAVLGCLDEALAHHPASSGDPELTVLAWEGRAHPFPIEPPPSPMAAWKPGLRFLEFDPVTGPPWQRVCGLIDDDVVVYWVADPNHLQWFERGSPLLVPLQGWLLERGILVVHAGAVATDDGAALVVGNNGAGKSTTSVRCREAGLAFLGDDYVAVDVERSTVHSLFCSAKLDWDHQGRVVDRARPVNHRGAGDEKALFFLADALESATLRAILVARVVRGASGPLRPIPGGRALAALAPSSVFQLRGNSGQRLGDLRALCATLPAFELELGEDLTDVADRVREAIVR
jgi:hypothetical protein